MIWGVEFLIINKAAVGESIVLQELTDREAGLVCLLFPHLVGLDLVQVEEAGGGVRIVARAGVGLVSCRECAVPAVRVQLDGLTAKHQRRTVGLRSVLERIALALVGRAGSRLAAVLGAIVSRTTLIRLVRALPDPEIGQVTVLGIDDWAKKRGHRYASVLVDMSDHRIIDILPDREADTFVDWLRAHPGVRVICRDRGGPYAAGGRDGAPDAQQVADRWHMWDDLGEYVKKTVAAHHGCIKEHYAVGEQTKIDADDDQARDPRQAAEQATAGHAENRARVLKARERYAQVQALKAAGKSHAAIQRELRLAPMTVRKYYRAASVDELVAASLTGWPSVLDDYKPYLHQRWNEGCTNISQLFREIKAMGYRGGDGIVFNYLGPLKGKAAPPAVPAPPKVRHITGWIRRNPDNLDADEQVKLKDVLAACPHLDALRGRVAEFAKMLTQRTGDKDLDDWIATVRADDLPHLHTFTNGLERDHAAVLNGLTLPYSSGAVEGAVGKIKFWKRVTFGRANLDLIRKMALLN